jgi:hypothetical protein
MTAVPLTRPMIELLLTLARVHRDELEHFIRGRFSFERGGRIPAPGDVRDTKELELVEETIKVLEEAK